MESQKTPLKKGESKVERNSYGERDPDKGIISEREVTSPGG